MYSNVKKKNTLPPDKKELKRPPDIDNLLVVSQKDDANYAAQIRILFRLENSKGSSIFKN